jgi:hypothetical protein
MSSFDHWKTRSDLDEGGRFGQLPEPDSQHDAELEARANRLEGPEREPCYLCDDTSDTVTPFGDPVCWHCWRELHKERQPGADRD